MRDFEYEAPTSLAAAVELLGRHNGQARPLAGGTDLIDHIRVGRLAPAVVVDIKKIPELNVLDVRGDGLHLGGAVSCRKIVRDARIKTSWSALHDACSIIGGMQIQSRASVGGNVCTSGAAADSTPALIALNAQCVIAGAGGTRSVPIAEFCTGPGTNVLKPGELLVEFVLPVPSPRSGSHYRRFIPRNEMDIAVVGVGASVTLDADLRNFVSARVALGAVAPRPIDAGVVNDFLAGKPADEATCTRAGELARTVISPIDDHRGTVEFRTHVTGVLVQRVLLEAIARTRGAQD